MSWALALKSPLTAFSANCFSRAVTKVESLRLQPLRACLLVLTHTLLPLKCSDFQTRAMVSVLNIP